MIVIGVFFGLCLLIFIVRKVFFSRPPTKSELESRLRFVIGWYRDNPSFYSPSYIDKLLAETMYYTLITGEFQYDDYIDKLYNELSDLRDRDPRPSKESIYIERLREKNR